MDEIVAVVVEKTGLSEEQAKMAVEAVLGIIKEKLPPAISGQLDGLLDGDIDLADAAGLLGGLFGK